MAASSATLASRTRVVGVEAKRRTADLCLARRSSEPPHSPCVLAIAQTDLDCMRNEGPIIELRDTSPDLCKAIAFFVHGICVTAKRRL